MSDQNNFTGVEITQQFEKDDIEKNKSIAGLAYIIFFLPLISCPDSKFAKFHANQALMLLIVLLCTRVIWYVPFLGGILSWAVSIVFLIYWILGIIDAFGGRAKQFPIIGEIVIIK